MFNPMDLTGRSVLVTGASSGIGRETASLLSQLGARLVLVGRNSERLEQTAERLCGTGHYVRSFDLTDVDAIPQWIRSLAAETGPLHGLVHSAGVRATLPIRSVTLKHLEESFQINVAAAVSLVRAFRQKGVRANQGSIVLLSSAAALVGEPGIVAYSACKGALIAATRSMAIELSTEGIRVNCVAPAMVETEMARAIQNTLPHEQFEQIRAMHPLGFGHPRDVANAIAFLLADTGRWITGSTLVVDGGYTAH